MTDLNEAWQAALDSRVETMVVQEDLHLPATVSKDGRSLTPQPVSDMAGKEVIDEGQIDAVDEMIEAVMQNGGRVRFVDNDQLTEHHGLAMITRF